MEIIAEIGQNHNGDMGLAIELIDAAKEAGADVAKFQLFEAKTLIPNDDPWFAYNCQTELSRDELHFLHNHCLSAGIEFMCSVFDTTRVQWLEEVGLARYKIASRSIKDDKLIVAVANTGKPYIASLGMWSESHLPQLPGNLQGYLFCVSKYPTEMSDLNFSSVNFDDYLGFSDHTIGITAPCIALARGAKIIEKHFTLDTTMYGPDHQGSMTPKELSALVNFKDELKLCL